MGQDNPVKPGAWCWLSGQVGGWEGNNLCCHRLEEPNINGLEFVNKAYWGSFKNISILIITTKNTKEDLFQTMKTMVKSYLVKLITLRILKEKTDKVPSD